MTQIDPGSIVVGADGSPGSDRAVEWAAEQAALERRRLVVFSATSQTPALVGAWPGPTEVFPADLLLKDVQAVANRSATLATHHRPGLSTQAVAVVGNPRTELADLTAHAHLLVLGSRGRGPVSSKLLGSVGAFVTRHASCPVVVCRAGTHQHRRYGVLVGADGTAASLPVIDFAFRQASLRSEPLTVLHSFDDVVATAESSRLAYGSESNLEEQRLAVAESVAGFGERYPEVRFNLQLAHGYAADTITAVTDRHVLVVIGHHPAETVADRVSVATATDVLERAHTNIAVVPEPANHASIS
jgi:nucleotide-binding universal stress UspA family protein